MMKIGIVGNKNYQNKKAVKNLIFELKRKYGSDLKILSTGNKYGVERLARECALELDVKYIEYPLMNESYNMYCQENGKPAYMYNKKSSPKYKFYQVNDIIKNSDFLIIYENKRDFIVQKYIETATKKNITHTILG